jgi:hypothetical protein
LRTERLLLRRDLHFITCGNAGTLTKASDVYSFGVIAWEVYTGRPPFRHMPDQGFVRDESFPRLPPHVPATFAKMALACVSQDPDVRPTFDTVGRLAASRRGGASASPRPVGENLPPAVTAL